MCGIVGVIHKRTGDRVDPETIKVATNLLEKRGPDGCGIWVGDGAGFGHRRLAVIDTSITGYQPMVSADGRYVLVFNGEIYNHKELRKKVVNAYAWRSKSDSEVVLAAYIYWGVNCLDFFHGMFAFAIWDIKKQTLFVARDRMGVKPLYYFQSPKCFAFSSRPRALHSLVGRNSLRPDLQSLRYYLEGGYIPAPYSFSENIKKLCPAHYLLINGENLSIKRYWGFNDIVPDTSWERRDEEELVDELDEIVSRSVRSRMISDVPLGAFLSGGIDSSLVVAMMCKYSDQPVKTFTIGFDEKKYDESPHAQNVANYLGTEHFCDLLNIDELLNLLPTFAEEFDEPFFDSSAFPTMAVSKLARKHVVVSLSGDGGDELFGGYHYYRIAEMMSLFYSGPSLLRKIVSGVVGMLPLHRCRLLSGALRQSNQTTSFAFTRSISKDFGSILHPEVLEQTKSFLDLFSDLANDMSSNLSPSEIGMRLDMMYTLSDDYLQKVDLGSMCFSLESREPLLDQELIEWAMKLPLKWKINKWGSKYLLRKLAFRYIPKKLLERPKQGFAVPIDKWLRNDLREWALERIHDNRFYTYIPIDKSKLIKLFELHNSGTRNVHPLLWAVLMLIEYCNQYENI